MNQAEIRAEITRLRSQAVQRYNEAIQIHNRYSGKEWQALNVANAAVAQEYHRLIKEHYDLRKQADELSKRLVNGKYLA